MSSAINSKENDRSESTAPKRFGKTFWLIICFSVLLAIGFVCFIRYFGWLQSVNIWTQVGVVMIALLPLIVAGLVIVRKRFKLSSMFIAFTMFALFMGLTMGPVYKARQARMPAKVLKDSGAELLDYSIAVDFDRNAPELSIIRAPKAKLQGWVVRLLGDYAQLPTNENICGVMVADDHQLDEFARVVDRLPNLLGVRLSTDLSDAALRRNVDLLNSSGADSFVLIAPHGVGDRPAIFDWLENGDSITNVAFAYCAQAPTLFSASEIPNVEIASFQVNAARKTNVDWESVFKSAAMKKLKMLTLNCFKLQNAEAQHLSGLKNLKSLGLHWSSVSDFRFVEEMPNLARLEIWSNTLTDAELLAFEVPENVRVLNLRYTSAVSEEAVERFKESVHVECEVSVQDW